MKREGNSKVLKNCKKTHENKQNDKQKLWKICKKFAIHFIIISILWAFKAFLDDVEKKNLKLYLRVLFVTISYKYVLSKDKVYCSYRRKLIK